MKISDFPQGSKEWLQCRAGIPSASNFDCIITTKGERSKQREKYLYRVAGEAITGQPEKTYQSAPMAMGVLLEDEARQAYQIISGNEVNQVGFCTMDDNSCGCSPDGLIGKDGLIEIKNPLISTHVSYLLAGVLPTDYYQQTQGQLYVTGRKWLDFMSFYGGMKLLIIRVLPDKDFHAKLAIELKSFNEDLKTIINKIK